MRAVPVGLDIYASGLVAADRLPAELVGRMREAVVASLVAQRANPEGGIDELVRRYPEAEAEEAREGWRLVEPYIFGDEKPGSMDQAGWRRTLDVLCTARGLDPPAPHTVYRPPCGRSHRVRLLRRTATDDLHRLTAPPGKRLRLRPVSRLRATTTAGS